ncbi:Uncharacterised protein [Serratia quinivorans]|nr:Uncharacterised protein [Serratia quinivorans]
MSSITGRAKLPITTSIGRGIQLEIKSGDKKIPNRRAYIGHFSYERHIIFNDYIGMTRLWGTACCTP